MQHVTDACVEPIVPRAEPEALVGASYIDLAVAGMGCPSCANRIRNALLAQPGIVEVEADVPAGLARVWYVPTRVGIPEMLAVVSTVGERTQHRYLAVVLRSDP
jgi:copper chaperone CopZ